MLSRDAAFRVPYFFTMQEIAQRGAVTGKILHDSKMQERLQK